MYLYVDGCNKKALTLSEYDMFTCVGLYLDKINSECPKRPRREPMRDRGNVIYFVLKTKNAYCNVSFTLRAIFVFSSDDTPRQTNH